MATASGVRPAMDAERRFFLVMAIAMSGIIVCGFAFNLAMGRSTFAVPAPYHIHAAIFFGWLALYVAQSTLIAGKNVAAHRRLGIAAYALVPAMVVMGFVIMTVTMRRTGGPFFFDQNEFVVSNTLLLCLFAVLVFAALRVRRHAGWHRRLMLVAVSILSGPGIGRLAPMPLLIPNGWRIMMALTLLFPLTGMIRDKVRHGRVHPAWWWGVGAIVVVQIVADIIAYSPLGVSLTQHLIAGTPGAARPMHAFLPPG